MIVEIVLRAGQFGTIEYTKQYEHKPACDIYRDSSNFLDSTICDSYIGNPMTYRSRRVTVMGLGHFGGGVAVARWLAKQGALVTVTDLADEKVLSQSLAALADVPIARYRLEHHDEDDFRTAEAVVVNPAVRPGNALVELARQHGATIISEIELFLSACPAPVIAVTGSNGKSTTTAMTAAIYRAAGHKVWMGGNIGGSLLDNCDQIAATDRVILELSSFQLYRLSDSAPAFHGAIVTNFSPNHLDWHTDMAEYAAAKQRIFRGQKPEDFAVLNTYDGRLAGWDKHVSSRLLPLVDPNSLPKLRVAGPHNLFNAAMAATAAMADGCPWSAVEQGLSAFRGLPQRLERIAMINGRTFYGDSTSTTPESTIMALYSLPQPLWLIAGGHDKGFDFATMLQAVARRTRGAALYGEVGPKLQAALASQFPSATCTTSPGIDKALEWCWQQAKAGDSIVLSPGCSSHDQYRNFQERGKHFAELVSGLASRS